MEEWKIRQEIYHRLTHNHTDDSKNFEVIISEDIVDNAVRYFNTKDIGWIWPAKSYVVGICYAKWLSNEFGGDPLTFLADAGLLYNNDPYFKSYSVDPTTYEQILEKINGWDFDETKGVIPNVKYYFNLEFIIEK
jgi:hypothetical protein